MRSCGGDLSAFDALKDARGLEYELDRLANRAARDKQVGGRWGASACLGASALKCLQRRLLAWAAVGSMQPLRMALASCSANTVQRVRARQ